MELERVTARRESGILRARDTPALRHEQEQWFSSDDALAAATFLHVQINPYVVLTIHIFRTQLLAARAVGDVDQAAALEAAIRSLQEDGASGLEIAPAGRALSVAN